MAIDNRWTWHGGGIAAARAQFGDVAAPWLDLSTGINPHRWHGVNDCLINWNDLPDDGALRGLEATAAAYFGCEPEHVCALPGTEIGLRLLATVITGPAHYHIPSYRTHASVVAGALPLAWDAMEKADGQTLILANPNNPDGRILERAALSEVLARRRKDGWLIIDEAFADTHPDISMASDIADDRKLVVFRSFGKFFGLAGLRLGFVLGPRPVLAQYRALLGAWPLSAAAIAIGTAAYADDAWITTMRARLIAEAQALDAILAKHDYKPIGNSPLFILIEKCGADTLFTHLAQNAILTRPFDYAPDWLRIGLPGSAENLTRLDIALADYG